MALQVIFPIDQGSTAQDYATEWVTRGLVAGAPFAFANDQDTISRFVEDTVREAPQTLTLEEFLSERPEIGEAERIELEKKWRQFHVLVRRQPEQLISLLPGEKVERHSLRIVPTGGSAPDGHRVMYRRASNRGEIAVLTAPLTLDGRTIQQAASNGNGAVNGDSAPDISTGGLARALDVTAQPAQAQAAQSDGAGELVEIISTIAQFVGFGIAAAGCPIGGMALAGGAAVLGQIFGMMNPKKKNLLTSIKGVFETTLFEQEIQEQIAIINQTYTWFNSYNDRYVQGELDPKNITDKEWQKFYAQLTNNVLSPSQNFVTAVGKLITNWGTGDPDFAQVAMQPAMLGCNLHMTLLKAALLGDMAVNVTYESTYVEQLVSYGASYSDSLTKTKKSIEDKISDRLDLISGPEHGHRWQGFRTGPSAPCSYFTDDDYSGSTIMGLPSDAVYSTDVDDDQKGVCSDDYSHSDQIVEAHITKYKEKIRGEARRKYYYSEYKKINAALATMNENLEKYKNWQTWSKNNPDAKPKMGG